MDNVNRKTISYFVYILRTSSDTLYIGQTNNLERRLKEHKEKKGRGAKYTCAFSSVSLVYYEKYETRSGAMKREYQLKKLNKKDKELLISKT